MAAMPSTWGAAVLAWRDTRRALVAMPALAATALAILDRVKSPGAADDSCGRTCAAKQKGQGPRPGVGL